MYTGTSPLLEALSRVPVTWDETHVLAADVGELIVIARRSGDSWWIAAMTRTPQRISVPLWFLSSGAHESTIWSDAPESPGGLSRTARKLSSQDIITLDLADAGAAVVEVHR